VYNGFVGKCGHGGEFFFHGFAVSQSQTKANFVGVIYVNVFIKTMYWIVNKRFNLKKAVGKKQLAVGKCQLAKK
jgi:hypothetical protein